MMAQKFSHSIQSWHLTKLIVCCLPILLVSCIEQQKEENRQPNIVFIFADDLTYTAINALGNKEIETPNIDRLVNSGTTFSHAYNMGAWNGAVCLASRAMMISGRSLWNADRFKQEWLLGRGMDQTWGKLMENAGYDTYMTGKWHVDAKAERVFQNVVHVRPGMPKDAWNNDEMMENLGKIKGTNIPSSKFMPVGYNRPISESDSSWSAADPKYGGYWEGGKHWSEVLKDDALGFIKDTENSDKPFFMYLAFNAPHDPRQAPQEYLDKYPLEQISTPKSWLPEYPYKDGIGNGPDLRDEALAPFPRTQYAIKKHIQEYYALISHLDDQIGEILDGLEESGQMENTYVIFTADHGLAMGRHGLLGKQSQFDHSIRAPFIIMGPDITGAKINSADIYLQDAMATSLELAGVPKPEYLYFNSVMDLVKGDQDKSHYNGIYGAYVDLQRMIRKDGFKLIVYPNLEKFLLYDMNKDPEEMNDLSEVGAYHSKVNDLFIDLIILQEELNDTLDISHLRKNL
ncbi:sulfatase-like hydrolase/transferase [uncultured Eudoraea sp.]|uniref:sulfatase-like hydrolase/transferase n=1 Tax=uncultured Eudoraea sp. TaxID=1035614 RepID=UPI00260966D6|nr:sulfatase-like hydrolase/transferase [uncultured Eudoraea sp.]